MSDKIPESGSVRFETLWAPNEDVVVQFGVLADKTLTPYLFEADRYWLKQAVEHIQHLRSCVIDAKSSVQAARNEVATSKTLVQKAIAGIENARERIKDLETAGNDLAACLDEFTGESEGPAEIYDHAQTKLQAWWRAVKGGKV